MSNVVKLRKPKTSLLRAKALGIEASKDLIEEYGDKLIGRLYDQITLTELEVREEGMPEDHIECMTVAIITQLLVLIASSRNTLDPEQLVGLVQGEIDGWVDDDE